MLAVRMVLFAILFGLSQLLLRWFGFDVLAQILLIGVGLLGGSLFFTYTILGTFVIEPSRDSDHRIRYYKIVNDAVNKNKREQGLVLDMDAYYEGNEKYITKQEAENQKTLAHKVRKFFKDLKD